MCTAIGWQGKHFMFGRNLDLEYGFRERVTQVARGSLLRFAAMPPARTAYAMLGMAAEEGGFPLFAEAVNECGLCAAGLYFPHSAHMRAAGDMRKGERAAEEKAAAAGDIQGAEGAAEEKAAAAGRAIAPHEMVAALLARCADTRQARAFLQGAEVVSIPYKNYPVPALHWLVVDRYGCFVAEPAEGGLRLYDDPAGVLANEPPFPFQLHNLHAYRHLTAAEPACGFGMPLKALYHGTGGVGLPGDATSPSRFVRAAFYRANSAPFGGGGAEESVGCGGEKDEADVAEEDAAQMFHMLSAVEMVKGACRALGTDFAIAATGIAGPTGGTKDIPVGTIWVACGSGDKVKTFKVEEDHGRDINLAIATKKAMQIFLEFLREEPEQEDSIDVRD